MGINLNIMNSLRNKVQLIGNLGMNPEIKTLESGKKIVLLCTGLHRPKRNVVSHSSFVVCHRTNDQRRRTND